jgi:hypothetical protein
VAFHEDMAVGLAAAAAAAPPIAAFAPSASLQFFKHPLEHVRSSVLAPADMDQLVSPSSQFRPRRTRLVAVSLTIALCALVALVAVRRGELPATALASDSTITGDTMFEHAGDDGDSPTSLSDAAIAFGDKKSLLVEDHREVVALKKEVKTLEADVDALSSELGKRKGKIIVNVAVGAPGRPGDVGPMGPVRHCFSTTSAIAVPPLFE